MWNYFFKEMEKRAFGVGGMMTGLMGAMTAKDISTQLKEQKKKMTLQPPEQLSEYQVGTPNQYQFEGGKHTELKETTMPNSTMY
jgi:hypothetical protein